MKQSRLDVSINIRARKRQRNLIDQAAERLGRSHSEFMFDAACREAEDVLLDQRLFLVDAGTCERVHRLLEKPLPATLKLRGLIETQPPWGAVTRSMGRPRLSPPSPLQPESALRCA